MHLWSTTTLPDTSDSVLHTKHFLLYGHSLVHLCITPSAMCSHLLSIIWQFFLFIICFVSKSYNKKYSYFLNFFISYSETYIMIKLIIYAMTQKKLHLLINKRLEYVNICILYILQPSISNYKPSKYPFPPSYLVCNYAYLRISVLKKFLLPQQQQD